MTTKKPLLGRSVAEKMAEMDQEEILSTPEEIKSEEVEISKLKKSEISNVAREKMEAMSKYNLRPDTVGVKAELEFDDDLNLTIIAKKLGKSKQELAAEYILKALEKDMQKLGIFEHRK